MTKKISSVPYYNEIKDNLAQPGCAFCRTLSQGANQYIGSLLWEMVNDEDIRRNLNLARGYCNQHAWMLERGGAALGVTILMEDVLKTVLTVLEKNPVGSSESAFNSILRTIDNRQAKANPATKKLLAKLEPQERCPVCVNLETGERQMVNTLVNYISGPHSLADAYRTSDGLCLNHFKQALGQAKPGEPLTTLVEAQKAVWQCLQVDLVEFIRKSDHRNRTEKFGKEKDAWLRAIEVISGARPSQGQRSGLTQAIK